MSQSKIQPLLSIPFSEERPFYLDYSLQASPFQVVSVCLRCERLVGDLLEDLSDLGGILSLPKGNEVLGIVSISPQKALEYVQLEYFVGQDNVFCKF